VPQVQHVPRMQSRGFRPPRANTGTNTRSPARSEDSTQSDAVCVGRHVGNTGVCRKDWWSL
jgi:hypothetical protein